MIRTRRFKYCVFLKTKEESLVDLKNDPGEMRNVVDDPKFRAVLAEHRKLLENWAKLSNDEDASKYVKIG